MDQLTSLVPLLGGYPSWVRLLVFLYFVGGVAGYAGLVLFAPPTLFTLDAVRLVDKVEAGQPLVLEVFARNPTQEVVQVTELRLSLHAGEPPEGGLQGYQSVDGIYEVKGSNVSHKGPEGEAEVGRATVAYPFAGQDYAVISVPVAQKVEKGATDRFWLRLSAPEIPRPDHRAVDVVAVYNRDNETKPFRVVLR